MPFKHRVNEGVMTCTDCHNPHGAFPPTWRMAERPHMMDQALANEEPCLKCHEEKRGPFVYEQRKTLDMTTLRRNYVEDKSKPHPLRFFCSSDPYRFWGVFDASLHVACPADGATLFLLGTDRLGRDVLSRIL